MKHTRIIVTHYGGPDALQLVEEERPEPKRGEVRVKVLAAGVAFARRTGARAHASRNAPRALHAGWDLIGIVDRLGDGISGLELGQIVAAAAD